MHGKPRAAAMSAGRRRLTEVAKAKVVAFSKRSPPLNVPGTITRTAWVPPKQLSVEDWLKCGQAFGLVEGAAQWWLGDWWAFGDARYGERKAIVEAEDWDGPSFQTCADAAFVCNKFKETSRRREVLSFNHHRTVAGRPPKEADRLLNWAEEPISETGKARSIAALRKEVRASVRAEKKAAYLQRIETTKAKPLEGTYRIILADPPWKYHGLNQADEYGHAEAHYDCLDDNQLMEFRPDGKRLVKEFADDDAVLFMWVTAPLLERCFPIIKAWGFRYKTNFVWDKIDHVMGFYNSVRHEHLLIATRGSCTPDNKKLFDSVRSIKRTAEHSRKPPEFYDIIETLYDHGRKLEIFARSGREGWDSVGNEVDLRAAA
jgi:N6-adenosine-specific RNA methylase IME4